MTLSFGPNDADVIRRWREHPAQMVRELFGVTPDAWQEEALETFPQSRRMAMKACAGPGKGLRLSARIDTPDGNVRWGDLKPGSRVFAPDGSVTSVAQIFPLGRKDIYRVTFDDGSFCEVTGEHLWKVRGRTERRQFAKRQQGKWTDRNEAGVVGKGGFIVPSDGYSVLTTMQIIERGVMTVNRSCPAKQFEIPRQGPVQFARADQPLDPYLAGVWIGDGSREAPRYHKPYVEVEQELQRRGYTTNRGSDDSVRIMSSVAAFKHGLGEVYQKASPERWIPDRYKYASVEQRTDLLCGLMDTDGCIGDDSHMEYDTTSERLANDVVWLVRSLGGVALIKAAIKSGWYRDDNGRRVDCRDCYRVTLTLPFNPFRIPHKRNRWHMPQQRYLTRYIASIEKVDEDEAMCIEVDHPSHCHLANDFIVTHNTAVLAWLGWNFLLTRPNPMIGVTSISGDNLKAGLWTELARWRNVAPILVEMFEQTKTEIFLKSQPRTWRMEARTWAKDADAQQIGNALAGVHAQYVMWLLDETGDYPEAIMPVCEGIFNGEPIEAHIVQAGNPTRLSGPLYRACTVARHLWKVIEITADPDDPKRTPRVSIAVAREQIAQYGRDNPYILVRIFGKFPPAEFNALIGPDEVAASMKRTYREHELQGYSTVMGIDVAREGDDASVIFARRGPQAFIPKKYRNIDSIQGAGAASRIWDKIGADACFVDATGGFGSGWIDQLRVLGRSPIGIHFSQEAHQKERYYNKRTEMYFDAIQWIKEGGALPDIPELAAALTQTTYTFSKDRLLLAPKDDIKIKLGYSPDDADAFVLSFAEPVVPKSTGIQRRPNVVQTEYNPFRELDRAVQQSYQSNYDPYGRNT